MELVIFPDNRLIVKTDPITNFGVEWLGTGGAMLEFMREKKGCGLAANQIGLDKSIIVIDVEYETRNKKEITYEKFNVIALNPFYMPIGMSKNYEREGCLSIPNVECSVPRYDKITITYFDYLGKKHVDHLTGIAARVWQHEVDHINGKLMIDRINKEQLNKISDQLSKLSFDYWDQGIITDSVPICTFGVVNNTNSP